MSEIIEAFELVLGEEFVEEMAMRLLLIACVLAAVIVLVVVIAVWKAVACGKIKNAVLALSEHPDDRHAESFIDEISRLSSVGIFFAKHGNGYSGLTKSDVRVIYNSTVLISDMIGTENKKRVRDCMIKVGCTGLTDIVGIQTDC